MTAAAASRRGDDRELVALARGGGLNFIGAAITQLTTVGLLLYMTRDLSKNDVGVFRISVALYELLVIVALVGLGQAMTRYVAVFRADRDRAAVLGAIRLGLVVTTVFSVVVAAALYLVSPWLSDTVYNKPELVTPLRFVAFAIPPGALTAVALAATFTTQGLLWLDLLILPAYVSASELAIYSVATSIVVMATFAMSPISQSLAPRIADLHRRKQLRRLAIAYQAAASWMLRF